MLVAAGAPPGIPVFTVGLAVFTAGVVMVLVGVVVLAAGDDVFAVGELVDVVALPVVVVFTVLFAVLGAGLFGNPGVGVAVLTTGLLVLATGMLVFALGIEGAVAEVGDGVVPAGATAGAAETCSETKAAAMMGRVKSGNVFIIVSHLYPCMGHAMGMYLMQDTYNQVFAIYELLG